MSHLIEVFLTFIKIKQKEKIRWNPNSLKGFTLIELLVVVALVAALAVILVLAMNPTEILARTYDTSRKTHIVAVGQALGRYTVLLGQKTYPSPTQVESSLLDIGELNTFPKNPSSVAFSCASIEGQGAVLINGYCYNSTSGINNSFVIYAPLVAKTNTKYCPPTSSTWYTWTGLLSIA